MKNEFDDKIQSVLDDKLPVLITQTVTEAIRLSFENPSPQIQQLNETIKQGDRTAEKLIGDIKRSRETIDRLQAQAKTFTDTSEEASNKAIKDYLKVKNELKQECINVKAEIQQEKEKFEDVVRNAQTTLPTAYTSPNPGRKKDYPDEYNICGNTVVIRNKKYQEDVTPLKCTSNDDLMTIYQLFVHVPRQYGIHITALERIFKFGIPTKVKPHKHSHITILTLTTFINTHQHISP